MRGRVTVFAGRRVFHIERDPSDGGRWVVHEVFTLRPPRVVVDLTPYGDDRAGMVRAGLAAVAREIGAGEVKA